MMGRSAPQTLVGKVDSAGPGASWTLPFPVNTVVGDVALVVLSSNGPISPGGLTGWTTQSLAIDVVNSYTVWYGWKVLTTGDIAGTTLTSLTNCAATLMVFHGPTSVALQTSSQNNASGPANGSTMNLSYSPVSGIEKAVVAVIATRSITFSATLQGAPWVGATVNGVASSHSYQELGSAYVAGANVPFANVQNISGQQYATFMLKLT